MTPQAVVLAAPGTNRDADVSLALRLAGAEPVAVRLSALLERPSVLTDADIVVIAGGFSHADALGAGRLFALQLMHGAGDHMREVVDRGTPVIGICNGFQVLTSAGLLPGALTHNAGGSFQCRWVRLEAPQSRCRWTQGIEAIDCPIAHGEGRYVHDDPDRLDADGQIALTYARNPNGSDRSIAGVCNAAGNVLGLMPHPENHVLDRQAPRRGGAPLRPGLAVFQRAVSHATR
jgi:phosphoribosylformylglycinamidine synthase